MKRHLSRKQFELLHNTLGVMAADLTNAENSFHQGKKEQCACKDAIKPNLGVQFLFTDKALRILECLILLVFP